MAAIRSLKPAIGSLVRNPIIIVVAAVVALLQLPQLLAPTTSPLLSTVISLVMSGALLLFLPFYQGGIIGMADESRTGTTSIGTLIQAGKSNYVSLLLSYVVVLAIGVAFGIIVAIFAVIGGVGLVAGGGQPSPAILAVGGLVGLLLVVGYLGAMVFIQFYGHEIVLNDAAVAEGFKRSVTLVRENLLSAIGYSLLMFLGGGLIGAVSAVTSFLVAPQEPFGSVVPELSLPVVIGAGVVSILATALLGAFYATYSVTFYRDIAGSSYARL
ncbi:DUF7847 domain-containing protein [Halonotius roseus]|uniref:DUF7847 domain-containing protein n=1 Tax=Halonotius roseus TaxID=2511997 RepID=A0A544QRS6_9EURY|nr:hypothetical protein [Halonotius roseus]TQQ82135.1 hypothetical protein EWF95_04120 [Halonotius roseus]